VYAKNSAKKYLTHVDIGYFCIPKLLIDLTKEKLKPNISFEQDMLSPSVVKGEVYCIPIKSRYFTVGTMERLNQMKIFLKNKKIIFLDRDGVLNRKMNTGEYVTKVSDFSWKKGSLEALKILKHNNYEVVVVTNQAGIGRGMMTEEELVKIHHKMCHDAIISGGEINYIYYCPHHWDVDCECRKPKPGMLIQAQKDIYFDMSKTYFIGDDERDREAANSAGCKFRILRKNDVLSDIVKSII